MRIKDTKLKLTITLLILVILLSLTSIIRLSYNNDKSSGYTIRIVVSGSMEPEIKTNSINIIKICNIDSIKEQDIICFKYTQDIVHRVIEIHNSENGVILHTKGDANDYIDGVEVNDKMIIGKVVKTLNFTAPLITKYQIEPGKIDTITLSRNIMIIGLIVATVVMIIIYIVQFLNKLYKVLNNKKINISKYMDTIDELVVYSSLLKKLNDSEYNGLGNSIAKARALIECDRLYNDIDNFKKALKNTVYLEDVVYKYLKNKNGNGKEYKH